ncbi:COP9 signalosome complex subunit 3 like protein [Zymoseptoria brevis]|uniref:COP9 signalosome complex subunit 3 like protein n=1 Tax=Zymoseptoria brevis TaxID=1047168 RepID=A0A0F4GDA0_9PEZI|nr:COP9 signalosome complex subunit 3 like protein [Zymoseptoria brevis]
MADELPTMLAFPSEKKKGGLSTKEYDTAITTHVKQLKDISSTAWEKKDLLEMLDPAVNSIPYLFALNIQITNSQKKDKRLDELVTLALDYLVTFDPIQVRYVGEQWRLLFEFAFGMLEHNRSTDLTTLVTALLRLDPTSGTLTSSHLRVVRLCLAHGVPSQALPLLDKDIYAYPQKSVKNVPDEVLCEEHELSNAFITEKSHFSRQLGAEHVLEYYLLAAHVYIGYRNFPRARLCLECVLLTPSQGHTTSALQAEAYQKWLLIGLISEGKPFPAIRTLDSVVAKSVENATTFYKALVSDFQARNLPKFRAEVEFGGSTWADDGNLRLVRECENALQRYRVIDLQKTYAALPIVRVAALLDLQPEETLLLLQDMISRGYLRAELSPPTSNASDSNENVVLRFLPDLATTDEADIEIQTERIAALVNFVRDAERRVALSREFVEWQRRSKRAGAADGDLADAMDLSWDEPGKGGNSMDMEDGVEELEDDEDLMT